MASEKLYRNTLGNISKGFLYVRRIVLDQEETSLLFAIDLIAIRQGLKKAIEKYRYGLCRKNYIETP